MTRIAVISIFIAGALYSCSDASTESGEAVRVSDTATFSTADLFADTDSLELIYYPVPAEQKRYSFAINRDSVLIQSLVEDLGKSAINASPCTHYKKAYLYRDGNVYKTVYISDSCSYLAFVTNGEPQYRRLSESTRSRLEGAYLPLLKRD